MNKIFYTVLVTLLFFTTGLQAQNYLMDGTPINDCSGFFLDSGGNSGSYGPNENFTTTICPDLTSGTHIQLVFSGVDLSAGDALCFFDGDNTGAPPLSCAADFDPGTPFIIQATAVNPGGCLTITFNSDATGEGNGFSADINCIAACQTILADLVMTDPPAMPADTGWIDICPGEGIFFEGAGIYPQDGEVYNHSDFTSSFSWNFGDGVTSEGPTAFHVFDEPGGYIVQLSIVDQFGCRNTNFLSQRVRVSTYPDFEFGIASDAICAGDTIQLAAGAGQIDSTYNVSVTTTSGTFQTSGVLSDSLALPDGVGVCYETPILFSDFTPGQILTNVNDFVSICVIMEHSWMFDLDIFLTCPDGTQIILQDQEFLGGVFLGEPIDGDGANPIPGLGYEYCWTPNATNGTWTDYYNANNPNTLPSDDYSPFDSFDNFLGCPLNGEWTITVCDQWGSDNGFIFEWSIEFASDLYPNIETYTPQIVDLGWNNNPSIFYTSMNEDSISASPQNAGTANYSFSVTNDFGCTFDTIVSFPVLPPTHPDCHTCEGELEALADTSVCEGGVLMLDGSVPIALGNQAVTFEAFSNATFDNDMFPPGNPLTSPVDISFINPGTVTDATSQIISVCVNILHNFDSDIELFLQAPNGSILELSSDNGGSGNNYTETCFTPDAGQSITAGTAPFTGDFQPEGDWTVLNGSPLGGIWSLLVGDDQNGGAGTLLNWTITFSNQNDIAYTWDPSPDLSCLDCPDPEVTGNVDATYNLEAEDSFGCTFFDTVAVQVLEAIAAPTVDCGVQGTGEILFSWDAIAGAGSYEISLDNGFSWIPSNGGLTHLINGLAPGEIVDILIRAVAAGGCEPLITSTSCANLDCAVSAALIDANTIMPSCFNTTDGSVTVEFTGATDPVEFFIDGSTIPSGPTFNMLGAGQHGILAVDAVGCSDSITFIMMAPDEVTVAITTDSVNCNGGADGSATALGSGGAGGFTYAWDTTSADPTLANVTAGTYLVTVADANGCNVIASAIIGEGNPIDLVITEDPANCNGESSGSASVVATGGTGVYTYNWSNGLSTSTINNLVAGNYQVTVTDSNNCPMENNITVTEAPAMTLTFNNNNMSCFGTGTGSATAILTNAVEPVVYIWSNGAGAQTNDNITAGNYCLTVTDANNCIVSNCLDITEPTALVLSGSATPTLCSNGNDGTASVVASGGAAPYVYLWPNGQINDMSTNLMAGDYIVTVTDNNACEETMMITVTAASAITLTLDATPTNCFNTNDGTATVTPSGGMGNTFAFQWDVNAGLQTSAMASDLLPGDYCVTVTDNNNCTETDCITVAAPDALIVVNSVETPSTCFSLDNGEALIEVTGGSSTTYTYLWNDPNAQFSNPASMLAAGTYVVTVTDSNGCTIEESIAVTEPAELQATAAGTNITCFGETDGIATVSENGGTAPYTYLWSNGQTTAEASSLSAGTQTVTVTDNNGCTAVAMTMLTEPATELTLGATQTFVGCFEGAQSEAAAVAMGGTGTYNYLWSNGAQTANVNSLLAQDYTVTVSDANGCTATQLVQITELDEVTINVATVEPACFGESSGELGVNIVAGGLGGGNQDNYTYFWTSAGIGNQTTAYIDNMPGGQDFTVVVSDAQGCSATTTVFLDQPDAVVFELTPENISCNGLTDGTLTVNNIQNGSAPYDYIWDATAANQTTEMATNLPTGTFEVTLTDALGCTATNNAIVTEPEEISLSFTIENNICSGTQAGEASVQAIGGVGSYSYEWSNGANTASIDGLGTGNLSVTVTDGNGCSQIDQVTISQPAELSGLVQSDSVTCFGDQDGIVQLEAIGGTAPYLYQFDDGDLNGTNSLVGIPAGTYPVLIQDVNGCEWESEVTVETPGVLRLFAGNDQTITLGEDGPPIVLQAFPTNEIGDFEIEWSAPYFGTLICPDSTSEDCETPIVNTQSTITYTAYVTDENGCIGSDEITITVNKFRDIFVPTAFTPNGDAVNNRLLVHGDPKTTIDLFRIYDRWGTLLFETRDFQANDGVTGWDGSFKGQTLNPATFVWYIEASYIDGHQETFKGQTTLLR